MNQKIFSAVQYLVPQHSLSRAAGWLANTTISWIKNPFTQWFVKQYKIDMSEAEEENPLAYENFNAFLLAPSNPAPEKSARIKTVSFFQLMVL